MTLRYPFDAVIFAVLAGLIGISAEVWQQRSSAPVHPKAAARSKGESYRLVCRGFDRQRMASGWPLFPITVLL